MNDRRSNAPLASASPGIVAEVPAGFFGTKARHAVPARGVSTRPLRMLVLLAPLLGVAAALTPQGAVSLPLFARKYGMECSSCHSAAPRLNVFGMHFKQNGYRLPGTQGESPWDSTAKVFPIALVGNVAYHLKSTNTDQGNGSHERTSFGAFEQEQVEFHSAGTLAKQVSFHFDNNFAGAGGPLNSGMAFVQYDDLVKDGALNFKAGVYDADTPYLADSRKTTLSEYLSPVTLGAEGFELNGARPNWMYAAGLINSSRNPDSVAAHKPNSKSFNQLENVYVWVTREIGGHMVTGRVYLDRQDPRKAKVASSQHMQAELNAFLDRGRFILVPGYTYEKFQDQPDGTADRLHTGLLEATCLLDKSSRWVLTARLEHQYVPKVNGATGALDRNQGVMNLAYYVNPNARFGLDWAHGSDNVRGPVTDDLRGFVWVGY